MLFILSSIAFSNPINDGINRFNAYSTFDVPTLTDKQIDELNAHKVVKILDSGDGVSKPKRGIGLLLTAASPNDLWIAYSDDHFTLNPNFHTYYWKRSRQTNRLAMVLWICHGHLRPSLVTNFEQQELATKRTMKCGNILAKSPDAMPRPHCD